MRRREIGALAVSEIGMGCMGFSHGYGQIPAEAYSIEAIRRAFFEAGCNFFDTAEGYGGDLYYPGHNEQIVGKALKDVRKDAVIATKLHLAAEEVENASAYDAIKRHAEQSLRNLGTDYIDLYYWHRVNEEIAIEDVAQAMGRLIKEGVIREWGLSQVSASQLARAHAACPVGAVQNLYSMVERDCERDIFPYCQEHGIAVVPFSPIASGLLSGKVTAETRFAEVDDVRKFVPQLKPENIAGNMPIVEMLREFACAKHATPAQISLAWMLHKHSNAVPIPGSKNQERIMENFGAANVELTHSEFNALEDSLGKYQVFGHRGHVETQQHGFGNNWLKKQ